MVKLPDAKYYSLGMLEKRYECTLSDLLLYARAGQLKISVLTDGYYIEAGYYDHPIDKPEELFPVPDAEKWSRNETYVLNHFAILQLINDGQIENPDFECEEGRYLCVSSIRYTPDSPPHGAKIIGLKDLVVLAEHLRAFESQTEAISEDTKAITHSGTAGRPNAKNMYMQEMRTRAKAKKLAEGLRAEATYLHEWLSEQKLEISTPTIKGIENAIRSEFKKLKA